MYIGVQKYLVCSDGIGSYLRIGRPFTAEVKEEMEEVLLGVVGTALGRSASEDSAISADGDL